MNIKEYCGDKFKAAIADRYREWGHKGIVIKLDGLAGGKGVWVCGSLEEAYDVADQIIETRFAGVT